MIDWLFDQSRHRAASVAPRQNIQVFEVGGKQVFVPLVAFNVLYRGGNNASQTSGAFMWRAGLYVSTRENALHKRRCQAPLRCASVASISKLPPAAPKLERVKGIEPSS